MLTRPRPDVTRPRSRARPMVRSEGQKHYNKLTKKQILLILELKLNLNSPSVTY